MVTVDILLKNKKYGNRGFEMLQFEMFDRFEYIILHKKSKCYIVLQIN